MLSKNFTLKGKLAGVINKALIFGGFGIVVVSIFTISFLAPKGNNDVSEKMYNLASFLPEKTLFFANLNISQEKFDILNKISNNNLTSENIIKSFEEASKDQNTKVDFKNIVTEFNNTLEPQATIGIWTDNNKAESENVLITTLLKDKASVENLMKNLLTDKTVTFKKELIDGVEIHVSNSDKDGAYSVVDNVLLIGNNLDTVKQAIANHKSNNNFLKSKNVSLITSKLPKNPISLMIFNLNSFSEMSKKFKLNDENSNEKNDLMNQLASSTGYSGVAIDLNKDIFVIKSYTPLNLDLVKNKNLVDKINEIINTTNNMEIASLAPADSFLMFSSVGFNKIIDAYVLTLNQKDKEQYVQSKLFMSMMTGGMDVDKDILPLLSNELSGAATYKDKHINPALAITKSDDSLAVIEKLTKLMAMQTSQSNIQQKDIAGNKISVISSNSLPVKLAFGQIGNMTTVGTDDIIQEMASHSNGSIADTLLYKELIAKIAYKPIFVVFVNMEKLSELIKASNPDPEQQKKMDDIQKRIAGFLVTASTDKDSSVCECLVKLKIDQ